MRPASTEPPSNNLNYQHQQQQDVYHPHHQQQQHSTNNYQPFYAQPPSWPSDQLHHKQDARPERGQPFASPHIASENNSYAASTGQGGGVAYSTTMEGQWPPHCPSMVPHPNLDGGRTQQSQQGWNWGNQVWQQRHSSSFPINHEISGNPIHPVRPSGYVGAQARPQPGGGRNEANGSYQRTLQYVQQCQTTWGSGANANSNQQQN